LKGVNEYKKFLIEVGEFEPLILKKRLIYQWQRLKVKYPIIDAKLEQELLLLIAGEGVAI
jgi:hypothetical protein